MDTTVISPGVVHLSFPNRKELTLSLCRVQEFYEAANEQLRGKYFSWEAFVDAFSDNDGKISYFSFWSGFNFPGASYLAFLDAFRADLTDREKRVREEILRAVVGGSPFYVIGTLNGAEETLRHETLHALYHINDSYRMEAEGLVLGMDHEPRSRMREGLVILGYGDNVLRDEIQAYLGSGDEKELNQRFGFTPGECDSLCPPFRSLANRFLSAPKPAL